MIEFEKIVKNTGSTARDHLANERTLLAWVRTSIAMIALGIAIAKFSHTAETNDGERISGGLVGATLTCMGVFFTIYSRKRYHINSQHIQEGNFSINTGGIDVTLSVLVTVSLLLLVVVIVT